MQLLVPLETVIVIRDGKRVKPELNKAFPFTDSEAAELAEVRPEAVRPAVNEADSMLDLDEDGPYDDEIEDANEGAARTQARAKAAKGIAKAAGLKPAAAKAAGLAPDKVDDL